MHRFVSFAAVAGAVAGVALAHAGTASAQRVVLHAPDQVKACLCLGQQITEDSSALAQRRREWQEKQHQVEVLNQQVEAARPKVDINDPASIAAFKQLLARRDAAAQTFAAEDTPNYRAFTEKYNARVADFNRSCAGKVYDPVVEAQVQRALVCPKD